MNDEKSTGEKEKGVKFYRRLKKHDQALCFVGHSGLATFSSVLFEALCKSPQMLLFLGNLLETQASTYLQNSPK